MQSEQLTISGARPIPATLSIANPGDPAVLLLHGTASSRDEVAGLFVQLADALAARGVSSLRIDFAGCGESTRPQTEFTVTSQLDDALATSSFGCSRAAITSSGLSTPTPRQCGSRPSGSLTGTRIKGPRDNGSRSDGLARYDPRRKRSHPSGPQTILES